MHDSLDNKRNPNIEILQKRQSETPDLFEGKKTTVPDLFETKSTTPPDLFEKKPANIPDLFESKTSVTLVPQKNDDNLNNSFFVDQSKNIDHNIISQDIHENDLNEKHDEVNSDHSTIIDLASQNDDNQDIDLICGLI